jgi:DNA-binding transcriptional MerR regulator
MKRRGNRRYYQHHEVLLIRRIRDLLYDQGFTISGARNQLIDSTHTATNAQEFRAEALASAQLDVYRHAGDHREASRALAADVAYSAAHTTVSLEKLTLEQVRDELLAIRESLLA